MASLLERVLRTGDKKTLKTLRNYADAINVLEDEYRGMSDAELRGETERFKERYADGESLDDLLPEAFAAIREAADRVLGMRPYPVQLIGGIMIGTTIALLFIVRRIVEIERKSEALMWWLEHELATRIFSEKVSPGASSEDSGKDSTQSYS